MSPAPAEEYEEGMVRDLIKSAPDRYATVHPKELRRQVDADTVYLGHMDRVQLKVPANEAKVEIPPQADAEKVRRMIRDVIVGATGVGK